MNFWCCFREDLFVYMEFQGSRLPIRRRAGFFIEDTFKLYFYQITAEIHISTNKTNILRTNVDFINITATC